MFRSKCKIVAFKDVFSPLLLFFHPRLLIHAEQHPFLSNVDQFQQGFGWSSPMLERIALVCSRGGRGLLESENMEQYNFEGHLWLRPLFNVLSLLSACAKYSGDWFDAFSAANVDGLLSLDELRFFIALRVRDDTCTGLIFGCDRLLDSAGLRKPPCSSLPPECEPFRASCGVEPDTEEELGLGKHPFTLKPPGLSRCVAKEPEFLSLCPWSQGRGFVIDVTVSDSFTANVLAWRNSY